MQGNQGTSGHCKRYQRCNYAEVALEHDSLVALLELINRTAFFRIVEILAFWCFGNDFSHKSTSRSIPVSRTCWIMSNITTKVVLSAPVSILNPNPMYLPLPLGVLYLNQNVPLVISFFSFSFLL